jgi:ornithine decarboxylase
MVSTIADKIAKKNIENIATEIRKELTEDSEIDIHGVDITGITSLIREEKISLFDDVEFPSIKDILPSLISRSESSTFSVFDIGALLRRYRLWKKHLPEVEIFYAVKCNPDPIILKTLACLGTGFDVASDGEIELIMKLETNRDNIIFANPIKEIDHIEFARQQQVSMMTFDNKDELFKIISHDPDAQLVLRILVDNKEYKKSEQPFGKKFGCPMNDVKNLLSKAKSEEMDVIGVSFHVGSCCTDATAYSDALKLSKSVFDIAKELGFEFNLLDIGGGFPGNDQPGKVTFEEIANEIKRGLEEHFGSFKDLRIIAEPGRFFATSALILVTKVIGKKEITQEYQPSSPKDSDDEPSNKRRKLNDQNKIFHYFINSNIYGMFNNIKFDGAKPDFQLLNTYKGKKTYQSVIFGNTCDSQDILVEGIELPELACGDRLFVQNHGAYTRASASEFNGIKLPKPIYIFHY